MRVFAFTALLLLAAPVAADAPPEELRYDWVFFYYMAYDNDLERYGRPVLDMLGNGVNSERVAVLVTADFRDDKGLKRYLITSGEEMVMALREEGSAEEETLAAELRWLSRNLPARKYALVFLDHGGQLGQMSQDQNPGRKDGQKWLRLPEVAEVVTRWRKEIPGEVELLFLQQCGKGTLSNYYALKDAARYVMGSQTRIGAPNHYYVSVLRHTCARPEIDGRAVAGLILEHESEKMFTSYSVLHSKALGELPRRLDAVLAPLLELEDRLVAPAAESLGPLCWDFEPDERFFDGMRLLTALYAANGLDRAPLAAFGKWVKETLVTAHRVSASQRDLAGDWCGFSLMFPTDSAAFERYPDYAIYRETALRTLLLRLLRSP